MGFEGTSISLGHCASRVPPAAAAAAAAAFSTLSALAPPFTVDRRVHRPALNYDPYAPAWSPLHQTSSDDSLYCYRPPSVSPPPPASPSQRAHGTSTLAPEDALPYHGHGPASVRPSSSESLFWPTPSLALTNPFYPWFTSAAVTPTVDVSHLYGGHPEESEGDSWYLRGHAVASNVPYDVGTQAEGDRGNSGWRRREGPDMAPSFQQEQSVAPGFFGYDGLQDGWEGKLTEAPSKKGNFRCEHLDWCNASVPSAMSGASTLDSGSPVKMQYLHSSDVQNYVEGNKRSDFNSSYPDKREPKGLYPFTTYSSANSLASSNNAGASIDKHSQMNVHHVQPVSAYRNDMHKGRVSNRKPESSIDLHHRPEDNAVTNRGKDTMLVHSTNVNIPAVKITISPHMEPGRHNLEGSSFAKQFESKITSFSPYSAEPDHEQYSEKLDENLAEDSPCWKGAPSRHSTSRAFNTLVCDYAIADSKTKGLNKRESHCPVSEIESEAPYLCGHEENRSAVMSSKEHKDNLGAKAENMAQIREEDITGTIVNGESLSAMANLCTGLIQSNLSTICSASGQPSLSSRVTSEGTKFGTFISCSSKTKSSVGIDAQVIVKTIHNLSELLLSPCHDDAALLKEHDKELLSVAINNLYKCISRNSESEEKNSNILSCSGGYPQWQLFSLSQANCSNSTDGCMEQNRNSTSLKEKMLSINCGMGYGGLRNFPSTSERTTTVPALKLADKVMSEEVYAHGESPQAAPCENLWADVDDAVNLLSCRLQHLRSNICNDNHKHRAKDLELETLDLLTSTQNDLNLLTLSTQNVTHEAVEIMGAHKSTDDELKNSSAEGTCELTTGLQNHQQLAVENFQKPQHTMVNNFQHEVPTFSSCKDTRKDDADASIMARYKVLKSRTEQHGQVDSMRTADNVKTVENVHSPDGKIHSCMDFQPLSNPATSVWGYEWLLHTGSDEGGVVDNNNVLLNATDCTRGPCLDPHFSGGKTLGGFCGQDESGSSSRSYASDDRWRKQCTMTVRDGSSDWEHVLKERSW